MGVLDALSRLLSWLYVRIFGASTDGTPNVGTFGGAGAKCLLTLPAQPFAESVITAPDGVGRATIIAVGATLAELWVPDAHGDLQDVVLGYDDRVSAVTNARCHRLTVIPQALYLDDPAHPVFGTSICLRLLRVSC